MDSSPSLGKLRAAEWLTAASAVVLFAATFLTWFELPSLGELQTLAPDAYFQGSGSGEAIPLNVWDLTFARWFVYLSLICASWMVLAAIFSQNADWAVILATPTVIVSLVSMICLVSRVFSEPRPGAAATTAFYVAVAASIGLFAGACWAIRDDFVSPEYRKAPAPEVVHLDSAP